MLWHGLLPLYRGAGKRGEMTPQELERLGIAITRSADWIAPLAKLMGFCNAAVVRNWWTGKTKIAAPKQRKLYRLAGQPDTPLTPVAEHTQLRVARIMVMREQGCTYESIGQQLGITRQAVVALMSYYRCLTHLKERQCPVCSATFRPATQGQKCCSKRCWKANWRLQHRGSNILDAKFCFECRASFQPREARAKYCSRRCRNNHYARQYYRRRLKTRAAA
jgi:hypothetical protein